LGTGNVWQDGDCKKTNQNQNHRKAGEYSIIFEKKIQKKGVILSDSERSQCVEMV